MLKFRPHHFLCTLGFVGKGYSDKFVENYEKICQDLKGKNGDQVTIEVTQYTDSICSPCPHKRKHLCAQQSKIEILDQNHAKALQLKPGDLITWGEAKKKISENISDETFQKICKICPWKDLGVCLTAIQKNRNTNKSNTSPKNCPD